MSLNEAKPQTENPKEGGDHGHSRLVGETGLRNHLLLLLVSPKHVCLYI